MKIFSMARSRSSLLLGIIGIAVAVAPHVASAWDGVTTGQVGMIEIGADGVFNFTLAGSVQLCPSAPTNVAGVSLPTAPGNKSMLASLLAAKAAGWTVRVYANNASAGDWGCNVGAIDVL